MTKQPARFDPYIDSREARNPGPASYKVKDELTRNAKSISSSRTERMKPKRYHTDVPGAGSYRMQSEFGVYSAIDTLNTFSMPVSHINE